MARKRGCLGGCLRFVLLFLLIVIGLPVYMYFETRSLTTQETIVRLDDLPAALDGITIAYAGDFHGGVFRSRNNIAKAVDAINDLDADIILLGGDYVSNDIGADEWVYPELGRLSAPLGVYAVAGNHDVAESQTRMKDGMASAGIVYLENGSVDIAQNGASFTLIGAGSGRIGRENLTKAIAATPERSLAIFLAHDPQVLLDVIADGGARHLDLSLAAHTHGGQLSLFGFYYVTDVKLLFPRPIRHDMVRGWSTQNGVTHLTTRGVGETIPFRFLSPPEIHLITLKLP